MTPDTRVREWSRIHYRSLLRLRIHANIRANVYIDFAWKNRMHRSVAIKLLGIDVCGLLDYGYFCFVSDA